LFGRKISQSSRRGASAIQIDPARLRVARAPSQATVYPSATGIAARNRFQIIQRMEAYIFLNGRVRPSRSRRAHAAEGARGTAPMPLESGGGPRQGEGS